MTAPRTSRSRGIKVAGVRSNVLLGIATVAVMIIAVAATFLKDQIPGQHGHLVNAMVANSMDLPKGAPVRVAGVNVGKVYKVQKKGRAALLTLSMDSNAPVVRKDATLKIRPRIFLEGNYFVDLKPGSPNAPELNDGTLPITQASTAVQWDQVLSGLTANDRKKLQETIVSIGDTLENGNPPASQALNEALRDAPTALRTTAKNLDALNGLEPDDIKVLIASTAKLNSSLSQHTSQLTGAIRSFSTTAATLADGRLSQTIAELDPTLDAANSSFDALNAAFPGTRKLAADLLPGVNRLAPTIADARPWVSSARKLVAKNALRGWVTAAKPTVPQLAKLSRSWIGFMPDLDETAKCLYKVTIPAGNRKINDGQFTTGKETYKEFWYGQTGVAAEGQETDANGMWVRATLGFVEPRILEAGDGNGDTGTILGLTDTPKVGVRPVRPPVHPPYRGDVPCSTQPVPDPNLARAAVDDASVDIDGLGTGVGGNK